MRAYIHLETKPGTVINVINRIRENKHVISADAVFGRFDAILTVDAPTLSDINQLVYAVVQSDPDVIRTETSITLELKQPK
jgi:DNA-binding Lrp family transcriptional regulator